MKSRVTTILVLAATLSISAASVFAGQSFGRDSVYVEPGKSYSSARGAAQIERFGRDSVHVTKDTVLSRPNTVKVGDLPAKPGRA